MNAAQATQLADEWLFQARLAQLPLTENWTTWLIIGGRGSGKTRAGAEWINALVRGLRPFADRPLRRLALIGETIGDVREVMIEGPSGLRSMAREDGPVFEASRRRLVWPNGAIAQVFSAQEPDSLRGPQFEAAWCDEAGKWPYAMEVWDMLQFALRLGDRPRQLVTTTPRAVPLIKRLLDDPAVQVSRMRTRDNEKNLSPNFLASVKERYGGTRLGRQELDGELIEERAGALWTPAILDGLRAKPPGDLSRVVVAVDPPASSHRSSDACGIVVAGVDAEGLGWVLADATLAQARPEQWASRAVALYNAYDADRIVAEVNQGGDMVASIIHAVDRAVAVTSVHARRGKYLRAEPVAALYEQGRVRHAAAFASLEDEMCAFTSTGLEGGRSPDRLDALVWALSDLLLSRGGDPRIRRLG